LAKVCIEINPIPKERPSKANNSHATLLFCEKRGGKSHLISFAPASLAPDVREIFNLPLYSAIAREALAPSDKP
jgi:hypothetical protein